MKKHIPVIPSDWPFEHIPSWEYDEDGELEVSNFTCGNCKYIGSKCKCIDHNYMHFARPWFSCDVTTAHHTICRYFEIDEKLHPAGKIEWDALGDFDEWLRLWRKQWHPRRDSVYSPECLLIRANQFNGREFSDDVYAVAYDDFMRCHIMKPEGVHCLYYRHIERSRNPKDVTGYKWVHEGPGIWTPWEDNRYIKI